MRAAPPREDASLVTAFTGRVFGVLAALARDYGAGLELVDFVDDAEGARQRINAGVGAAARGGIPDLVAKGALDDEKRMVLVNEASVSRMPGTSSR